ncbi:hypothetical protein [Caenispirillum bisanense]|uniref:Hemolysin-type calcium-binding repeat-containing protein n=1 Tax=Caenispirillum bisanense TaxID=414052 RepID=A0A286GDD7_9PROT|nr:hypothetical protein [Caenispirillum bisanense]SOD93543.1 hypothetical protein SAMN05421508_103105 [Caenispirillum bisanense]
MEPIRLLTTLFPTPREVMLSKLTGNKASQTLGAKNVAQAVMVNLVNRSPDYMKRANLDAEFLTQLGAYSQAGAVGAGAGAALTKLQQFGGMLKGEDNMHAIARSSQRVRVGDGSVVEAHGYGDVVAGNNAFVTGGDGGNSITVGDKSAAVGGRGKDVILGGDNAMVRAGEGNDVVMVDHGSVVAGDEGDDGITVGANSIVDGGDGRDTITADHGSQIQGGAGDDRITLTRGRDFIAAEEIAQVDGGTGDDSIQLDRVVADITYRRGDGTDTLGGDLGGSTLILKDYRESDVTHKLTFDGRQMKLELTFANSLRDKITVTGIQLEKNQNFVIQYRGGAETRLDGLMERLLQA